MRLIAHAHEAALCARVTTKESPPKRADMVCFFLTVNTIYDIVKQLLGLPATGSH